MSKSMWKSGDRVSVYCSGAHGKHGTVIRASTQQRHSQLICMDSGSRNYVGDNIAAGRHRGLTVPDRDLVYLEDETKKVGDRCVYAGVPKDVGVFVVDYTEYDNITFRPRKMGRVIRVSFRHSKGHTDPHKCYLVSWLNFAHPHLFHDPETDLPNCAYIPRDLVRWGRFDMGKLVADWGSGGKREPAVTFSEGEVLVYRGDKTFPVTTNSGLHAFLGRGALLRSMGTVKRSSRNTLCVEVVGGCPPEAIGQQVTVSSIEVSPFKEEFFKVGMQVEIVADVCFKRGSLQGRQARVILPNDLDGDVGVQFPENIGAGSLDGAGDEGKCLYVPANTVKEVSG